MTPPDRSSSFVSEKLPEQYQARLAPVIFEPWAEQLLGRVGIEVGERVLDVACGTGVVTRAAAQRAGAAGSVVGADISPAMLGRAASEVAAPGAAPIEFVEGSADQLPLDDGRFDVVLCQQGLQFFPDKPAALGEMRRVTAPGGRLGLAVWAAGHKLPFDDFGFSLQAVGAAEPFPGAFEPSTFALSEDALNRLLVGAGYESIEIAVCEHTPVWPSTDAAVAAVMGTPFGPLIDTLGDDQRTALDAELRARFAGAEPSGEVARLMVALIARATTPD
jgi:SAM-dependent methyltransferase